MRINETTLGVLSRLTVTGASGSYLGKITDGQLDRKLYEAVNKVLVELGGKWNRGKGGHVFDQDPSERLDEAILTGELTSTRKVFQFYETPVELADRIAKTVGARERVRILEPSAGLGRIALACRRAGADVVCCELENERHKRLRDLDFKMCATPDFLQIEPNQLPPFDAVAMNPPFSRQQDVQHVNHAFRFLRTGGRICSVMSAGTLFRQNRSAVEFREWVTSLGGTFERLPEGTFKESGAGIHTVLLTLTKPTE